MLQIQHPRVEALHRHGEGDEEDECEAWGEGGGEEGREGAGGEEPPGEEQEEDQQPHQQHGEGVVIAAA